MKKIISILMVLTMVFSALLITGCGDNTPEAKELKLGLGVSSEVSTTTATATEDKNGSHKINSTAAVVLVDQDGKIVKAVIDCTDNSAEFTAAGEGVAVAEYKTKYEKGDAYNMVQYGGAKAEWYVQADKFCALIVGKTVSEIKALVAEGNKGNDEVVNAGCTIIISEFANAIEKAVNSATATTATENDTLKLGVFSKLSVTNATEDKNGTSKVESNFFAAAVNGEGKITDSKLDTVEVSFTFSKDGVSTFDATKAVATKGELGDAYNMVLYGGAKAEWYVQAKAFADLCIGKTATEAAGLMLETTYGNETVINAGCTISIAGFVNAVLKIK